MGKTDGVVLMMDQFSSAVFIGVDKDYHARILFRDINHSIQNDLSSSIAGDIVHSQTDSRWKLILASVITGLFGARIPKLEPEEVAQLILDLFEKINNTGEITK